MNDSAQETMDPPFATDDDSFDRGAALSDLDIRVRSHQFRGGALTAVMAGVTIDLREAELSPEGATIRVQSAMSGIDVLVPPDWDVVCDVDLILGGLDGERFPPPASDRRPRLRLTGVVVAGGLCVR